MRWTLPVWVRHPLANPARHLNRAVFALQDPAPPVRLPARLPEAEEERIWLSHWRHGNGTSGKGQGVHKGRIPIRMTGNFNIQQGLAGAATL